MITNPHPISKFAPSRWRRTFFSLLLLAAFIAVIGAIASSRQPAVAAPGPTGSLPSSKIAPWVMEQTANGQQAEFFVVLADQADLSAAANLRTKAEKGRFVFQTLLNKAQTTQGSILQWLRERGLEYRSFYIVNAILVKGPREVAEALAARPDVARIEGNPQIQNHFPQPEAVDEAPPRLQRPATIEPGINYTHAPQVWALGFTGQGIVVASADTGVRWTHNALKPHYRGWDGQNADHDYNWHDSIHDSVGNPCGNDSPFPCDDLGHGSHTTGTMIGDDGMGNQIGMAPGAKWIGCRNMDGFTGEIHRMHAMVFGAYQDRRRRPRPNHGAGHYQQLLGVPAFGRMFGQHVASCCRSTSRCRDYDAVRCTKLGSELFNRAKSARNLRGDLHSGRFEHRH